MAFRGGLGAVELHHTGAARHEHPVCGTQNALLIVRFQLCFDNLRLNVKDSALVVSQLAVNLLELVAHHLVVSAPALRVVWPWRWRRRLRRPFLPCVPL